MTWQNHKILIYSHDAYGMGNIRRTLAICNYLSANLPNLSILILTGSPVIHTLRIPKNVDYIKLPCLTRDQNEKFSPKFWNMQLQHLIRFRMDLILSAVRSFEPDVVLVDKKPMGIKKEFFPALTYVRECLPNTRVVLGLRDILDDPQVTIPIWEKNRYFSIIEEFYDDVWIYGSPQIFDAVREYRMPAGVAKKVVYTGYLGRPTPAGGRLKIRAELGLNGHLFSLVMAGGGGDGYPLLKAYVDAMHRGRQPLD
ncbi:MAG: glycosyltransferase, partial [Calditrichaeota bacterium]